MNTKDLSKRKISFVVSLVEYDKIKKHSQKNGFKRVPDFVAYCATRYMMLNPLKSNVLSAPETKRREI